MFHTCGFISTQIILLIVSLETIVTRSSIIDTIPQTRSSKALTFHSDDLYDDLFGEMEDPLNKLNKMAHDKNMREAEERRLKTEMEEEQLETVSFGNDLYYNPTDMRFPPSQHNPHERYNESDKIFWGSVGDIIQATPFLPVQVNIPDMISAMAQFFSNAIPFINRWRNPNEPRPQLYPPQAPQLRMDDAELTPITQQVQQKKKNKKNRITKTRVPQNRKVDTKSTQKMKPKVERTTTQKPNKQQTQKLKGDVNVVPRTKLKNRPKSKTSSTESPNQNAETMKRSKPKLSGFNTKLGGWNHQTDRDDFKFKNMPITRKNVRISDREVFNFKNSDITNSPIMILSLPSRPMYYHREKRKSKT